MLSARSFKDIHKFSTNTEGCIPDECFLRQVGKNDGDAVIDTH